VTKRFGETEVLAGVDLTVRRGEVLALVGPSGGGKSTLLRLVNGLETRDGGVLRVLGTDVPLEHVSPSAAEAFWRPLRRRIGFVFQAFHLYPHRTALDNVALAPERVKGEPREAARGRAAALLARVGLSAKADAYPRTLSGGQQQRVAIARALAMEPDVMLFDEPTSALDPTTTGEVLDAIRDLAAARERTMVIVTHELSFAREVADRAARLEAGRVTAIGTPAEVLG
jgi:ABC-type polar amino acid transport system ATPase subunit